MLGGIAFQLREYISPSSVIIILLIFFIRQSLLSYTHSALENFSYDTCGSDPFVLQNLASITEMPLNQNMI
jgi:hypothetical protein